MRWLIVPLVLAGVQWGPSRPTNTLAVSGASLALAPAIAWGVLPCPETGGVAVSVAFIVQASALGAGSAKVVIENHTAGTTMCVLTVPCTQAVGSSVVATCSDAVTCASGDVIHLELESETCTLGPPDGAGSGTIRAL